MDRTAFFAAVRSAPFGGSLSQGQADGMTAILDEAEKRGYMSGPAYTLRWVAYMLATTFHETDRTMQPIREYGKGRGKKYGSTYYGRGFVQLTWDYNYRKASTVVGVDLVKSPDRALESPIATAILFSGMIEGWFTSKKLADYINAEFCDYKNARRIVNGTDRAVTIAGHAVQFERALKAATDLQPQTHDQPVIPTGPPPTLPPRQPPDVPGVEPKLDEVPDASPILVFGIGGLIVAAIVAHLFGAF